MRRVLNAGADKISLCSAALNEPKLITKGADVFGSQCIVLSIDAKRIDGSWQCYIKGGRENTGVDALWWAKQVEKLGAGEILLNSIDQDGTQAGYDLELTRYVSESVSIPVIASGGAGTLAQIHDALNKGRADAVLAASILHYKNFTVPLIKDYLKKKGVNVR
jgi:cyclase